MFTATLTGYVMSKKQRKVHFTWASIEDPESIRQLNTYMMKQMQRLLYNKTIVKSLQCGFDENFHDVRCNTQLSDATTITQWAPYVTCLRCRKLMVQAGLTRESRSYHLPSIPIP